jgi:hypothetical protein
MAYVTLAEWKAYRSQLSGGVQSSYSAQEDAILQKFLDQAQAEIESQTCKRFEAATQTRYYRRCDVTWDNPKRLLLDAWLLSVTTLTNGDGAVISAGNYWLQPRGGPPYSEIELKSTSAWAWGTDGEIAIAGTWGYMTSADARVKRATMRLAEFFWQKRTTTGENQIINEGQIVVAAQYPKDVQDFILAQRRRSVG